MRFAERRKLLIEAQAVALSTWSVIFLASRLFDSQRLPGIQCGSTGCHQSSWTDFMLFVLVIHFLYVKSWLMWRRTQQITFLGMTLVWANVAFAVAYQASVILTIFPQLRVHLWIPNALRIEVLIPVVLASVMLSLTTDPDPKTPTIRAEKMRLVAELDTMRSRVGALEAIVERQDDVIQRRNLGGVSGGSVGRPDPVGDG